MPAANEVFSQCLFCKVILFYNITWTNLFKMLPISLLAVTRDTVSPKIHSIQGWITTTRHRFTRKKKYKKIKAYSKPV